MSTVSLPLVLAPAYIGPLQQLRNLTWNPVIITPCPLSELRLVASDIRHQTFSDTCNWKDKSTTWPVAENQKYWKKILVWDWYVSWTQQFPKAFILIVKYNKYKTCSDTNNWLLGDKNTYLWCPSPKATIDHSCYDVASDTCHLCMCVYACFFSVCTSFNDIQKQWWLIISEEFFFLFFPHSSCIPGLIQKHSLISPWV